MATIEEIINGLPWVEKYRPSHINQMALTPHITKRIITMIASRDIQNMILEGPPGVGKTSTIKCMGRELYGPYYNNMVLELNASDDRGIKIQEAIENFRRSYVHFKEEDRKKYCMKKLIILDEADNMTAKAKYIISTLLENKTDEIRFAFTCNIKNNILPSIQSRCLNINYPKMSREDIYKRLARILIIEKIVTRETSPKIRKDFSKGLRVISEMTDGDLRNAINILQIAYNRFGIITYDNVYSIYDKPRPELAKDIFLACIKKDISDSLQKVIHMKTSGYSGMDVAMGFVITLRMSICNDIDEIYKIAFMQKLSQLMYNVSKGVDTILQLSACIIDMIQEVEKIDQSKIGVGKKTVGGVGKKLSDINRKKTRDVVGLNKKEAVGKNKKEGVGQNKKDVVGKDKKDGDEKEATNTDRKKTTDCVGKDKKPEVVGKNKKDIVGKESPHIDRKKMTSVVGKNKKDGDEKEAQNIYRKKTTEGIGKNITLKKTKGDSIGKKTKSVVRKDTTV